MTLLPLSFIFVVALLTVWSGQFLGFALVWLAREVCGFLRWLRLVRED